MIFSGSQLIRRTASAGEYAEIVQPLAPGPQVAACSGAVWQTVGSAVAQDSGGRPAVWAWVAKLPDAVSDRGEC